MKKKTFIVGIAIIILVGMGWLLRDNYYYNYLVKVKILNAPVCYDWDTRYTSVDGVPHKECACDGRVMDGHGPGVSAENGTYYCLGEITGYQYTFSGRGFFRFDNLEEWSNYCDQIDDEESIIQSCYSRLEETTLSEAINP